MKTPFAFLLLCMVTLAHAEWTPPQNPNLQTILTEAYADAAAKRFDDALAKHVWFHNNALKINSSFAGVRLSFALSSWVDLGAAYPPALEKLKNIRDEAEKNVRAGDPVFDAFFDFEAINTYLKQEQRTLELFLWLDSNKPEAAKKVFDLAEPALVQAKEYRLCGKYIETDAAFQSILKSYQITKQIAKHTKYPKRTEEHAEKSFSNGTATLVSLLVINERKADADRVAAEAIKEWNNPEFKTLLEKAKNGIVPPP